MSGDDVLSRILAIRKLAETSALELSKRYLVAEHVAPLNALNMCFNHATACFEVLNSYYNIHWKNGVVPPGMSLESVRDQNTQRVMLHTKNMLISSMSSIEFALRETAKSNPSLFSASSNGKVYMSTLVGRAHANGLLTANEFELWEGAIDLRNTYVHNNGVADKDRTIHYGDFSVVVKDGIEIMGTLFANIDMTKWIVVAYAMLCGSMLKRLDV